MKNNLNTTIISNSIVIKPVIGIDNKGNPTRVETTLTPIQRLQCQSNVTTSRYNHYTRNQVTAAYEQYLTLDLSLDENTNFIKDFYLDKNKAPNLDMLSVNFNEKLVTAYMKTTRSAYDLANIISQQMVTDQLVEIEKLKMGKTAVKQRLIKTITSNKYKRDEQQLQWKVELRRLFHQMREAVKHILDAKGEAKFSRLNDLMEQKKHITVEFLQELPKKSNQEIKTYLENVRLLLSKKTDELIVLKELYGQDFVYDDKTVRELSESGRSGGDSASMLSEKLMTSKSQKQKQSQKEDEKKIVKYYDVKQLKEKWQMSSEQKIKSTIRRTMVRETMMDAEQIRAGAYKEDLIRTGKWGQPMSVPKPVKVKTKRQIIMENAKADRKARKDVERVRVLAQSMRTTKYQQDQKQVADNFFANYNASNTNGECFDAANRYSKLFY